MFDQIPHLVDQVDFENLLVIPQIGIRIRIGNLQQVLDSKFKLKLEASFYVLDLSSYPTLDTSVQHSRTPQII
jgi:hypothetical protein